MKPCLPRRRRPGSPASVPPRVGAAGICVVSLLSFTNAAHAQLLAPTVNARLLEDYLNTGVAGIGTEPGVTATSHPNPEYEPIGIALGSFILHPTLTEQLGYDSNVNGVTDGASSGVFDTAARVALASGWSNDSLYANATVDRLIYFNEPAFDETNWSVLVGGSHDIGHDKILATYTHENIYQSPRELNLPQINSAIPYHVDDAQLAYVADLGRILLTPAIDGSTYGFADGEVGNVPYRQGYRDRYVVTPSLTGRYQLAPRRNVVLLLQESSAFFPHRLGTLPSRNYTNLSILTGLDYDTGGPIQFRVLGGYEVRLFQHDIYETISAPAVRASVTWTPTGLTTVVGTLGREIDDSADSVSAGYTATTLHLELDHEYLRNVLLSANAEADFDDYTQQQGSQQFYSAGASAAWLLNRNLRLKLSYVFAARVSPSTETAGDGIYSSFGKSYTDNRLTLQVEFGL